MSDEKLIKQLKKKKYSALNEIIKIYTNYISVVIYNTSKGSLSKEDIEEILSDVFVSLWTYSEKLDEKNGNLKALLSTIARNKTKNRLSNIKYFEPLDEMMIANDDIEQQIEKREQDEFIYQKIMELGLPDSEVFIRYYYNGEKTRVIADSMGINHSTVKTKLKRGREKLKQICKEMEMII